MRFHQLEPGARFRYRNEVFVKKTPLVAIQESSGQQKLIPKSADIEPLDSPVSASPSPGEQRLDRETVVRAFESFYEDCVEQILSLETAQDGAAFTEARRRLARARERFLESLKP